MADHGNGVSISNGLELRMSSNGSPPDRQGGQSTQSASLWYRVVRSGVADEWFPAHGRSLQSAIMALSRTAHIGEGGE